ncbi:MAG: malate dehydrogenase, partial [Candidatus Omnitrophica bacterium]|nr:malate dehydrogenase [Candidatus Omnitrophota bacterium]
MKVAVIGAGNVGGTLAQRIVEADLCDVVLVDIASGMARAKALDLADAKSLTSITAKVEGTGDYKKICASDIVVVTAGFPRQPGMTREDLLKKNVSITRQVVKEVAKYARDCILIMVTNPLDILTYVALKESNFNPKKVIGMGGVLDSSRFSNLIAQELNVAAESVKTLVIGAHGEAMMPLLRYCTVNGIGVLELLSREKLDLIVENTIKRGAEIVSLLGKGSAYYAPSA